MLWERKGNESRIGKAITLIQDKTRNGSERELQVGHSWSRAIPDGHCVTYRCIVYGPKSRAFPTFSLAYLLREIYTQTERRVYCTSHGLCLFISAYVILAEYDAVEGMRATLTYTHIVSAFGAPCNFNKPYYSEISHGLYTLVHGLCTTLDYGWPSAGTVRLFGYAKRNRHFEISVLPSSSTILEWIFQLNFVERAESGSFCVIFNVFIWFFVLKHQIRES